MGRQGTWLCVLLPVAFSLALKEIPMLQTSGLLLGAILFTTTVIAAPCPSTSRPPQTFFVSPNGNPANADGTVQHPFSTVQAGIDCAAVPGDHVFIYGGIYTELLTVRLKN